MGEAIMVGRGAGISAGSGNYLVTQIFTENTVWKAPKLANQNFSIRIFGGGGGAYKHDACIAGGGGGFMNNAILNIPANEEITITIGTGGAGLYRYSNLYDNNNRSGIGGTTSFGTYLSALGGCNGSYIASNTNLAIGGYGGSGGGSGGTGFISTMSNDDKQKFINAAKGYQFGGGGGYYGGNGGYWGGGGAGNVICIENNSILRYTVGGVIYEEFCNPFSYNGLSGLAGNGGSNSKNAENGTNTIGLGLDFEGAGLRGATDNGNYYRCGGGGYGGNGGGRSNSGGYGGGGGYGANGGHGANGGGGGGGYGGDGGDGGSNSRSAGGGGGYGKAGKGGGYGKIDGGIAAGGGCANNDTFGNGGNGICIIQYYI